MIYLLALFAVLIVTSIDVGIVILMMFAPTMIGIFVIMGFGGILSYIIGQFFLRSL